MNGFRQDRGKLLVNRASIMLIDFSAFLFQHQAHPLRLIRDRDTKGLHRVNLELWARPVELVSVRAGIRQKLLIGRVLVDGPSYPDDALPTTIAWLV